MSALSTALTLYERSGPFAADLDAGTVISSPTGLGLNSAPVVSAGKYYDASAHNPLLPAGQRGPTSPLSLASHHGLRLGGDRGLP